MNENKHLLTQGKHTLNPVIRNIINKNKLFKRELFKITYAISKTNYFINGVQPRWT
jgi:hypothetical protein